MSTKITNRKIFCLLNCILSSCDIQRKRYGINSWCVCICRVPCDSADPKCQSQLRKWNHQRRRYPSTCIPGGGAADKTTADLDDPFAMLQELITDGSLIKEAVRRLQLGLTPKLAIMSSPSSRGTGKGNNFYDSEDEDADLEDLEDLDAHIIHATDVEATGAAE